MKHLNGNHSQQSRIGEVRSSPMTSTTPNGVTDDTAPKHHTFSSSFYNEAMKILIRIYLCGLKACPLDAKEKSINKSVQLKYVRFVRENVNRIYGNHLARSHCDLMETTNPAPFETAVRIQTNGDSAEHDSSESASAVIISDVPILHAERRLSYLNAMPPINDSEQSEKLMVSPDGNVDVQCENDERRKAIVTVIKLQVVRKLTTFHLRVACILRGIEKNNNSI